MLALPSHNIKRGGEKMKSFWRSMKRFGRAMASIVITGTASYVAQDEKLLLFAPVLMGIGKWLREKFKLRYIPF